jgi:callose synthase
MYCLSSDIHISAIASVSIHFISVSPVMISVPLAHLGFFRSSQALILPFAVILVGGGVASSFLVKSFPLYVMDVALGYRFHPSTENVTMKENDLSLSIEIILSFLWIASSTLLAALLQFRNGIFLFCHYFTVSDDTSSPSTNDGVDDTKLTIKDSVVPFRDASPGYSETFNVFNPFELPPRLEEYAHLVYSASEDIGNFFGFQDASVRNQAEHLLVLLSNNRRYMSSHILPPSLQPPSPIHALHAKVFSNYMKWCRSLSVLPNFSKRSSSMLDASSLGSRVTDLILWFCIWGESANLRHMPECILFLYHKMMEEFIRMESVDQTRSLYAGHYLDNVVMPIYNVIAKVRSCFPETLHHDLLHISTISTSEHDI